MLHKKEIGNNGNTRDTSIKEESEPCELHEQFNCNLCEREMSSNNDCVGAGEDKKLTHIKEPGYSKHRYHLNTNNSSSILKRSISSNAVNNVNRRTSLSFSTTNLQRTLSQSSCYSTGSTQSVPIELQEESFNEFFNYVTGNDQYNKVNNLWEILPRETKDVFIKRVLAKKKKLNNGRKLVYNDLKNVLIMRDGFNLYAENEGPYPIHISNNNNNNNISKTNKDFAKSNKKNSYSSQREQILSQIIGEIFEEVSKREVHHIQGDHQSISNQTDKSPIGLKSSAYQGKNLSWNVQARTKSSKLPSSVQPEPLSLEDNTTMEKIRLWRDRQEINDKISELNRLIERYEKLSPMHTPVSNSSSINNKPDEEGGTPKQINNITTNENSCTIFDLFATKSKKFIGMFKHKKKSSKFDLYRKPNPTVQQLMVSELKEVKKT